MDRNRCMVCMEPGIFPGGICDRCKAKIRGEALGERERIKKDADRSLRKEGTAGENKSRG